MTKSPIVSPEESIPPPKYEEVMNQKVVIMVEDDNPPPSFEDVIKEEWNKDFQSNFFITGLEENG